MIKFILNPFDILFFGSGKPFNVNVQEAISIFPPFPNTLASSICSKIYSEKGINIKNIIKSFYGPFLQNNKGILFPKPLDILGEKKKINRELSNAYLLGNPKLINPSYTDLKNDLKNILWQKSKNKDFEIFESFITLDGLKKWLNNQEIENCDLVDKK
ncbi:MAG: type III-B CRISPR module-associated Cmr3 family protein, partial [Candidatus Pacearchaeota archaeon]